MSADYERKVKSQRWAEPLWAAIVRAATADGTTPSEFIRAAVIAELRARGLWPPK